MYFYFVWYLLQPYLLLYLLAALAVGNLWRKRRETRRRLWTLTGAFLAWTLVSMPAVSYLAAGSLEWPYPPVEQRPTDAGAIVVLTGSFIAPDEVRHEPELQPDSVYRCLHTARLYRQGTPCRIVVSGGYNGPDDPGMSCAAVMRDFLVQLGVKTSDILVEEQSRNTYESAVACRRLLDEYGIHKVVLVTDGMHLRRSLACFGKQGLEVVPAGCNYRATRFVGTVFSFLPDADAMIGTSAAAHEWLGLGWYWLRGRI